MVEVEEKYMARCIELAKGGRGNVSPNPMVGAVVVHKGRIIGEGFHRKCGEAHAEVNAIASVKDESLLKDSTIYVSLEPCSHYGKTPPCAELIIRKGIPRVVVGCLDPFPEVSGRGVRMLREAGAKEVHMRVSSPPFLHPCYFGTDVPEREQLIAHNRSVDEICRIIGADSLGYLRLERLSEMVDGLPVCRGCFTGEYPLDPPTEDIRGEYDR